ncbi:hypothetical protein CPB86DRAFT_819940 [Serendipita vermifera]|nr:hypothetical protein CPB86DRAFT_819940 [Serendipita vermifera]
MASHGGIKRCEKCGKTIKTHKGGLIKHLRACKSRNRRQQSLRAEANTKKTRRPANAQPLSIKSSQIDEFVISADGLPTLKRARSPGHKLDSNSPRKRRRLNRRSGGQDENDVAGINRSDEEDELEGPNGWRPRIEDLVHHRGSYFSADLPFPSMKPVPRPDSALLQACTSAIHNAGLLLESIRSFKSARQYQKRPSKFPVEKAKCNEPVPESSLVNIDHRAFKASIQLFLRHLLGVESSTPVEMWPQKCCCGSFKIDLGASVRIPRNAEATNYFVTRYIESYHNRALASLLFVQPHYVTPFWVSKMFRDHFEVLRASLTRRLSREGHLASQKRKRRRERKLKKFRRRLDYLSGQQKPEHVIKFLNDIGIDGMSEEESDVDNTQRPFFWLSNPLWRSAELSDWLHKLDQVSINRYRRVVRASVDSCAVIPVGLPINFYSEEWASSFRNIETLRRTMKRPVDLFLI